MAGRLIIPPTNPSLDANGLVAAGSTLTFYQNGTTTLVSIYTAPDMATPLANPLTCDAAGRFPQVWADDTVLYSVKWTVPGASPVTYDNIGALNAAPPVVGDPYGLGLSTAGSSATFAVAAGRAADSTGLYNIALASALSKTTSAWAAGTNQGALDTGVIAINTWYHVFVIKNPTTGVSDVLISTNVSAPTMPSGYTLKRRIGSLLTNSSSQWVSFTQFGDEFIWAAPFKDKDGSVGLGAALLTITVPPDVNVRARLRGFFINASVGSQMLIQSPSETSAAPSATRGNVTANTAVTNIAAPFTVDVTTDTSRRIRYSFDAASNDVALDTYGWLDTRGRYG